MTKAKPTGEDQTPPVSGQTDTTDQPGADAATQAAEAEAKAQTEAAEAEAAATAAAEAEAKAAKEAAEADAARIEADRLAAEAAAKAEADRLAAEHAEALRLAAEKASSEPELNLSALTYCARQIDMLNTTGHRLGLIDELQQLYGMQVFEREGEGITVTCEGVTTDPADTVENALTNWANAARRACLKAAA